MTLASRLLLLIGLALLPPLAIQGWSALALRNEREMAIRMGTLARTQAVQAGFVRLAEDVRELLIAVSEVPSIREGDTAACTAYLKTVSARFVDYSLLGANAADGSMLCSSAGVAAGAFSNAGRAYHQRAMRSGGFAVGDLVVALVSGRRSIHFALPFERPDGTVGGIVLATVDQERIQRQLRSAVLPPGSQAFVLDPSGVIVAGVDAASQSAPSWVGEPAPPALRAALNVAAPALTEMAGPDGRTLLFGAVPPATLLGGMVVVTGLDMKHALADVHAAAARNLIGLAVGAVLAVAAALLGAKRFVFAPIARLASAASRVGAGEASARADLGRQVAALPDLGAAFGRMSLALASREGERDQAQAAWLAGQTRLERLLTAAPAGILEFDPGGTVIYANPAAERISGVLPGGLDGSKSSSLAICMRTPDNTPVVPGACPTDRALAGEHVMSEPFLFHRTDGVRIAILVDAVPVRSAAGLVEGALTVFQDVSTQYEAVQALQESEARFRRLADSAPALIWTTDQAGDVTFANLHHDTLFGEAGPDGRGRAGLPIVEDDLVRYRADFDAAFTGRVPFRAEVRVRDRRGRLCWLACEGVPRLGDAGVFLGYTCCAVDITQARLASEALETAVADRTAELSRTLDTLHREVAEREQTEAQLRQAQKMEAVGQLTGGIAHDFNNMLQGVAGSLEVVQRRVEQGRAAEAPRYLDAARESIDRAAALTQRLLAFARRQALQPRAMRPGTIVRGIADLIRGTIGDRTRLVLDVEPDTWTVRCDPNQMDNVLLNLAINARDAMPDGGTLTIRAANIVFGPAGLTTHESVPAGDYVELSVTDTGIGMDEATRARAFEPFFTTKPLGQGTGLGLSQVYGFARQSEGTVWIDSAPGQGTTVRIFLPRDCSDEALFVTPAAPVAPASSVAGVLLLVEDVAMVRLLTAEHLRDLGYTVLEAADGPEAVAVLRSGCRVDALITDVGLPGGLNGRQVAEIARQHHTGLPVLFVTGFAGGTANEQLAPGMEMIGKPYSLASLSEHLKGLLDNLG